MSFRYVAPFVIFVAVLAVANGVPLDPSWSGPLWFVIFVPLCIACWPRDIQLSPTHRLTSIAVGLAVFVIWIAPDLLIPDYRDSILFSNHFLGYVHGADRPGRGPSALAWRAGRATLIVPVVEELFWRGWLMRWLIHQDFERVPLGAYTPAAFWITAALFASEHGPFWDVGLAAGVIYNLWMIHTKSVADCILMHGVTNGALCVYIIGTGRWQYWQ